MHTGIWDTSYVTYCITWIYCMFYHHKWTTYVYNMLLVAPACHFLYHRMQTVQSSRELQLDAFDVMITALFSVLDCRQLCIWTMEGKNAISYSLYAINVMLICSILPSTDDNNNISSTVMKHPQASSMLPHEKVSWISVISIYRDSQCLYPFLAQAGGN